MFFMLWSSIALFIMVSFAIQGIYAQEEGRPLLECRENFADQCSTECLEKFENYTKEYRRCLNVCIDNKINECPMLPPYELDFAQESTTCPKAVYMDEKHEKYSINAIQCVEKKIENCDLSKTTFRYIAGPLNLSLEKSSGDCFIDILQQDWGDYGSRPYQYECSFTEINEWKSWQNSTGGTFYNDLADCGEVIQEELTPQTIKNMIENLSPEFKTPKQQTNVGILPSEVQCKEGLELIFKSTDGSPACVKPKTAEKLIERGWASS